MNQGIIGLPTYRKVNGPSGIVWGIEDIGPGVSLSRIIDGSQIILGTEKINGSVAIQTRRQGVLRTVPVNRLRGSCANADLIQDASRGNVVTGCVANSIGAPVSSIRDRIGQSTASTIAH